MRPVCKEDAIAPDMNLPLPTKQAEFCIVYQIHRVVPDGDGADMVVSAAWKPSVHEIALLAGGAHVVISQLVNIDDVPPMSVDVVMI